MRIVEYFIPRLNGWLSLSLDSYISLLFSQEDKKFCKIKIPKGLPLTISEKDSKTQEELSLVPGNFIEVLIKQNLILETNNKKGQIQIANLNNNQKESKSYDVWTRAKIISNDTNSKLLFVELNDQIIIIDNMELVRSLKEIKPTENTLLAYNLKQISNNEYNLIKEEFEQLLLKNSNNNKLLYIKYDVINTSLLCFGNKDDLSNLLLLKQHEKNNKKMNGEEQNTNSDFSNPNSNNNLIGVKIPAGNSDNGMGKDIILDNDIKNEINEYKYKKCFTYRDKFKKDIEKNLEELFQKTKYYVGKNNDNNFDIIIYGNNEDDFMEEKNNFEKKYKQVKLENDMIPNKNEVNDLAMKSKIKFVNVEKKNIYLVGEEKNINNFRTLWEINKKYSKEIQKTSKENENIQKELQTFKKKLKIK